MTLWWPDTCGCSIEIDDEKPSNLRIVKKCPIHELLDDVTATTNASNENIKKNRAWYAAESYTPSADASYAAVKVVRWEYDKDRALTLYVIGLVSKDSKDTVSITSANDLANISTSVSTYVGETVTVVGA